MQIYRLAIIVRQMMILQDSRSASFHIVTLHQVKNQATPKLLDLLLSGPKTLTQGLVNIRIYIYTAS